MARGHGNRADAPARQEIAQKVVSAAVEGDGVNGGLAGAQEGQKRSHDGGHPGVEYQRGFRAGLEGNGLRFEDFRIGMIQAGVDQVHFLVRLGMGAAVGNVESALGRFRAGEDVS